MAIPVVMPKLGMVMSEGPVARYAKAPGEAVTQGEIIAEIETEKLNYDLEATGSGRFHPVVPEGTARQPRRWDRPQRCRSTAADGAVQGPAIGGVRRSPGADAEVT